MNFGARPTLGVKLTEKTYKQWVSSLCRPCLLRLVDVLDAAVNRGSQKFNFAACAECDPKIDAVAEVTVIGDKS